MINLYKKSLDYYIFFSFHVRSCVYKEGIYLSTRGGIYLSAKGKKANIVITELFNNAVENNIDGNSKIVLELKIDKDYLWIRVKNNARRLQYKKVKAHVKKINTTKNLKKLMTDTIRERRKDRLKGGLGLIRLVAENKFDLSVHYRVHFLIVESRIALGGLN